jgi:hypothetical protein
MFPRSRWSHSVERYLAVAAVAVGAGGLMSLATHLAGVHVPTFGTGTHAAAPLPATPVSLPAPTSHRVASAGPPPPEAGLLVALAAPGARGVPHAKAPTATTAAPTPATTAPPPAHVLIVGVPLGGLTAVNPAGTQAPPTTTTPHDAHHKSRHAKAPHHASGHATPNAGHPNGAGPKRAQLT